MSKYLQFSQYITQLITTSCNIIQKQNTTCTEALPLLITIIVQRFVIEYLNQVRFIISLIYNYHELMH